MELIPIKKVLEENEIFIIDPLCQETLQPVIDFYKKIGFVPPWICYYAKLNGQLVGSAGFKGKPINGKVEIAYATFEKYRQQGIGSEMCRKLVELSLKTDPNVIVTATTLPEYNFSCRILQKNNFEHIATIVDPEDGEVWEWQYGKAPVVL